MSLPARSVRESRPAGGTFCLVWTEDIGWWVAAVRGDYFVETNLSRRRRASTAADDIGGGGPPVTHWCPLPDRPPEE